MALLIMFSAKRTIVDETSKFSVTSKTLKEADKKEHVEKRVMYIRNYLDAFIEGSRKDLYTLGLWASTTRKNTEKCVHVIDEQFLSGGNDEHVFKFTLDRSHCSNTQGEPLGEKAIHYPGPVIKDLNVIWEKKPKYGPHNTILITSSITEAALQPRNVIYIPDFDASRKSVDNALGRLHFLIQTCQNPDDPKSVTDARYICDLISRMPGFGFPQLMLLSSAVIVNFVKEANPFLLQHFISQEKLKELGLSEEEQAFFHYAKLETDQDKTKFTKKFTYKGDKVKFIEEFTDKMDKDANFMHIMSNFVFNLGYLSYLRENEIEMPECVDEFINNYEERLSITYTNRTQLTKQNDVAVVPPIK